MGDRTWQVLVARFPAVFSDGVKVIMAVLVLPDHLAVNTSPTVADTGRESRVENQADFGGRSVLLCADQGRKPRPILLCTHAGDTDLNFPVSLVFAGSLLTQRLGSSERPNVRADCAHVRDVPRVPNWLCGLVPC